MLVRGIFVLATTMGNCFSSKQTHKGIYLFPIRCHIARHGLVSPSDSFPTLLYIHILSCTPPHLFPLHATKSVEQSSINAISKYPGSHIPTPFIHLKSSSSKNVPLTSTYHHPQCQATTSTSSPPMGKRAERAASSERKNARMVRPPIPNFRWRSPLLYRR